MQDGLRLVAYNFLSGGSAKRAGQWSRVLRTLEPDVVFGEECRPTGDQLSLPTLGGDDAPSDDRPPPRNRWAWLLGPRFRADLDKCPRCGGAYALGRGCAHSAFYRQALGRVRHGAPISTARAPTLVEPALSTVRALPLSPSRLMARSKTPSAGRLPFAA